jgi:enoyl-CoA hydratase
MIDTGDVRIKLNVESQIAVITIARPEKLNALDFDMIKALERAALLIDANNDVRAAIITGEGEKAFCAGGDIAAWSAIEAQDFGLQWVRVGHRAFDALTRLRQPLIAALNGSILGGGLELATCADFRIGEDHIKIGLPETHLGIIPGWSGTQRAVKRIGSQVIRRMALLGEVLNAEQGLHEGVLDRVVVKGTSLAAAHELAKLILVRSNFATASTKMMINAADGEDQERALEALGGIAAAQSEELKTGLKIFKLKKSSIPS